MKLLLKVAPGLVAGAIAGGLLAAMLSYIDASDDFFRMPGLGAVIGFPVGAMIGSFLGGVISLLPPWLVVIGVSGGTACVLLMEVQGTTVVRKNSVLTA